MTGTTDPQDDSRAGALLDARGWRLLEWLQHDGRAPLKTLASAAGLSVAATAERLKRLLEGGTVRAVQAQVVPERVGYAVKAIIGITVLQPRKQALLDELRACPQVLECHHVTGADSYLFTLVARNLGDLEAMLGRFNVYGETRTSIVMSTPIAARGLRQP